VPIAGIGKYHFEIVAAVFRQRSLWRSAVLALVPLLASCGWPSPSGASTKDTYTTKADGVAQPLHVAQVSYVPKTGMRIVGSPNVVWVWGQSGQVTFGLFLTNKGTASYDCTALEATQIPANGVPVRPYAPGRMVWTVASCPTVPRTCLG
jgi:hypothetical protein